MQRSVFFGLFAGSLLLAAPVIAEECAGYAQHLKSCEAFVCSFKHPFTHTLMQKQIVGTVGGKCKTTEEMPNKGKLECHLSAKTQAAVAQELAKLEASKLVDVDGKVDAAGKAKTPLKADGESVHNALEDAMNSGECTVSGYSGS